MLLGNHQRGSALVCGEGFAVAFAFALVLLLPSLEQEASS